MPLTELPNERIQLTFGMYGDGDFFTMKGVAEDFLYAVGLKDKIVYNPEADKTKAITAPNICFIFINIPFTFQTTA